MLYVMVRLLTCIAILLIRINIDALSGKLHLAGKDNRYGKEV